MNIWDNGYLNFQVKTENINPESNNQQGIIFNPIQQNNVTDIYYKKCTEVRNAGAAPISPGDSGWNPNFDRDNDGVGCE